MERGIKTKRDSRRDGDTNTMKAICYIQLVANRNRSGAVVGIAAKNLSQKHPKVPLDGSRLVRIEIHVPDDAFKATQVSVSIPMEKLAAAVTATVG